MDSWTNFIDNIGILERLSRERQRIFCNISTKMAADGKVNTLDKFLAQTPSSGEKRGKDPDSPDCISPSLLQVEKQARIASSSNDSDKTDIQTCKESNVTSKGQMETVLHLSEVICATLKNQEFLNSIIPMISGKSHRIYHT